MWSLGRGSGNILFLLAGFQSVFGLEKLAGFR